MHKNVKMENLFKEKYYKDIIVLLGYFQNRTNGLRQKHFRYLLMNNENDNLYFTEEWENFFKEMNLSLWYKMGLIKKGSISSQKNLNYYLKHLFEKNVIEKVNRRKPIRYRLTSEFYNEFKKMQIRENIERWDRNNIFDSNYFFEKQGSSDNKKRFFQVARGKTERWVIFGLPTTLDDMFTKDEINEIKICLKRIQEDLWKIVELKYKKTGAIIQERKKQLILEDELGSIDFFYNGRKMGE